ncbi:MAG: hypothetical protein KDI36_03405 [Pseudomonadales bacterium]|nr:hypothetical protein [Pseudomonadales bacterium]
MTAENVTETSLPAISWLRSSLPSIFFAVLVAVAALWGWQEREEYWLQAERGLGYALGITGLSLMLLLLLYPLRKHWRPMRNLLAIRYWFQMHMAFGVLGPLLIMFHANFGHGSVNSTVALYSMLLVAGSGLIGRYVYVQIHKGIYGEAIRYEDLLRAYEMSEEGRQHQRNTDMETVKQQLSTDALSMLQIVGVRWHLRRLASSQTDPLANRALARLRRMARLRQYERLFSWWHIFHLPVFLMMLITATVHVVVVHMY